MPEMTPEQIKDLYHEISSINANISRIHFILNNDDETDREGLVKTVHIINRKVEALETEKKMLYAKASAYGAVGAILAGAMAWFISFIATHFIK